MGKEENGEGVLRGVVSVSMVFGWERKGKKEAWNLWKIFKIRLPGDQGEGRGWQVDRLVSRRVVERLVSHWARSLRRREREGKGNITAYGKSLNSTYLILKDG